MERCLPQASRSHSCIWVHESRRRSHRFWESCGSLCCIFVGIPTPFYLLRKTKQHQTTIVQLLTQLFLRELNNPVILNRAAIWTVRGRRPSSSGLNVSWMLVRHLLLSIGHWQLNSYRDNCKLEGPSSLITSIPLFRVSMRWLILDKHLTEKVCIFQSNPFLIQQWSVGCAPHLLLLEVNSLSPESELIISVMLPFSSHLDKCWRQEFYSERDFHDTEGWVPCCEAVGSCKAVWLKLLGSSIAFAI